MSVECAVPAFASTVFQSADQVFLPFHSKTFMCKDVRKKLDPKAKKCILDYAAQRKGYHLYYTERLSIIFSRDVVFNESSRGIETEQE